MENVFRQIIVIVIQDIIHLIVNYIFVMEKNIMIQLFVQEIEIALQQKHVIVIMGGN
jgi:hypothetical protein